MKFLNTSISPDELKAKLLAQGVDPSKYVPRAELDKATDDWQNQVNEMRGTLNKTRAERDSAVALAKAAEAELERVQRQNAAMREALEDVVNHRPCSDPAGLLRDRHAV